MTHILNFLFIILVLASCSPKLNKVNEYPRLQPESPVEASIFYERKFNVQTYKNKIINLNNLKNTIYSEDSNNN